MQTDNIISALIGLVGACNSNPKTANTDRIVIKALAFPLIYPDCDDQKLQEIIDEIHKEKDAVSPGCALCAMPCGNTSDYDMNRIYDAADEIRKIKLDILSELQKTAARIVTQQNRQQQETLPTECIEIFYKALAYVSYDREKQAFLILLEEVQLLFHTIIE